MIGCILVPAVSLALLLPLETRGTGFLICSPQTLLEAASLSHDAM